MSHHFGGSHFSSSHFDSSHFGGELLTVTYTAKGGLDEVSARHKRFEQRAREDEEFLTVLGLLVAAIEDE